MKNLSPIGESILRTFASLIFYEVGQNASEIDVQARKLLNLYELSLHSMSESSYCKTPRLFEIAYDHIRQGCKIRDLRLARQHSFPVEQDDQLAQMIMGANQEFAESVKEMKEEMLRLESSVLPNA